MSDEELKEYLREHVVYEMQMMRYTSMRLSNIAYQLEWNMCYESFAVHARILKKLLKDDEKSNNIQAKDYLKNFKAEAMSNDVSRFLALIEPQVFHLGKTRMDGEEWKNTNERVQATAQWIEATFAKFISQLPSTFKDVWDDNAATPPEQLSINVGESKPSTSGTFQQASSMQGPTGAAR